VGSRTHGRGTFFVNSDKESTQRKRRPLHPVPEKNIGATSAPNFANGSVGSAVRADQPQFAVHGELPLPKLEAEAGCRGEGESKAKI